MHRFTSSHPFSAGAIFELDPDQSHHLAKVLRLEVGEVVGIVDGKGGLAQATLLEVKSKGAKVRVDSALHRSERSRLSLCFGLPKGQALDFIFRRATELGIQSFQPLQTQHSAPAKGWNADRWSGVVSEVCKQCEELHFPQVLVPQPLSQWLKTRDSARTLLLCDEQARLEKTGDWPAADVDLLVGAEGGFSRDEVELLKAAGAQLVGLGRNRLRAETASLVALVLVKKEIGEI